MKAACGVLYVTLCVALAPGIGSAANRVDPDWPCIQPKVEKLSAGLMWPHPITPVELSATARELVETLSLSRVSPEEAEAHVKEFVSDAGKVDVATLGTIFQGVFDGLALRRERLIGGIARYSHKQIALADKIAATRDEMAALEAAKEPDHDKIDALEARKDWDERIYHDRARSLTYVCETPVLLEKRAYTIARILLKYVPE